MAAEQADHMDSTRSPLRADFYRYSERRPEPGESRNSISVDKTTAMILGAIASAAIAVGIAGGTALVQKVEDTAKEVERSRAERIASFGEIHRDISVVETKLSQLIGQIAQLETRVERTMQHDLEQRDRRIEAIDKELRQLQADFNVYLREPRRPAK